MDIEQRVIKILKDNTKIDNLDDIELSEVKFSQLGINSLNFIKIIVELEDEFDIEFNDNQINYKLLNNMNELVSLIKNITWRQ